MVVTEVITEVILGIEWMKQNECVWDFGKNLFTIRGHRVRLRCKGAGRRVRRILVRDDVVVPGRHTVEIPVLVTRSSLSRKDQNWGMTTNLKDSDLVIANAICGNSDVQSVCQVINISDLPKRWKHGSELGKAEPIEVVEIEKCQNSARLNEVRRPACDEMPLDLKQIRTTDERKPDESDLENFVQTDSQDSETVPTDFVQEMLDKIDLELTDKQ